MPAIDDDNGDDALPDTTVPTEEIYLELEELEEAAQLQDGEDAPAPAVSSDDPSSIKARIARLRAMLSDRGAPIDE